MTRLPHFILAVTALVLTLMLGACGTTDSHDDEHSSAESDDSWAVTAWGDQFEIFAEADGLVAGAISTSHTHVTILSDFSPLDQGVVSAVLRGPQGTEESFRQDSALRDGIFSIEITPQREGTFDLFFKVETSTVEEEIPAGQVQVGPPGSPGGLVPSAAATPTAETTISFLKEQQWRTEFSTAWIREGSLSLSVQGPGSIQPVAGGEDLLTAAVDGSVLRSPWPYPGLQVVRSAAVFRLIPVIASGRSLAQLEGTIRGLEAELGLVRARATRLSELLQLGAVSGRETEENDALIVKLEAQLDAARLDLESVMALRHHTGSSAETIAITAPFAGQVAEVLVTPGQAVTAGTPLARLVKTTPVWAKVALRPEAAARVADLAGLYLRTSGAEDSLAFSSEEVRLISLSPGVDAATGTVDVLLEVESTVEDLRLWSSVEAELLLAGKQEGIVIPTSAVVDDGGISIIYVQPSGEEFLRREIRIVSRQGSSALVEGVSSGERLVTRGGNAIRRATLVAAGPGEGHVH